MAGKRGARAPRLLRRARQHRRGQRLPHPGDPALVPGAPAPQPAPPPGLEAHEPPRDPMAPTRPHHASLPRPAIRRPHPRQEPSALAAHAGICAGGRPQGRSLPRQPVVSRDGRPVAYGLRSVVSGKAPSGRSREGRVPVVGHRGGSSGSSGEGLVMGLERSGRAIQARLTVNHDCCGRSR